MIGGGGGHASRFKVGGSLLDGQPVHRPNPSTTHAAKRAGGFRQGATLAYRLPDSLGLRFPHAGGGKQAAAGGLSLGTPRRSVDRRALPGRKGRKLSPVPHRIPLTQRKPMLLLAFVGVLLLRFAHRALLALLFHEPPRNTRLLTFQSCPKHLATPFLSA